MTLNTTVTLRGPIELRQGFELALSAILHAADRATDKAQIKPPAFPHYITTVPGQGLPAWTDARRTKKGNVRISWDTAYGYEDTIHSSASSLHRAALVHLHETLPDGVTMRWVNEFTGKKYDGLKGLETLT